MMKAITVGVRNQSVICPRIVRPRSPPIPGQIPRPLVQSRSSISICRYILNYCWPGPGTGCGSMGEGVFTAPRVPPRLWSPLAVLSKSQYLASDGAESIFVELEWADSGELTGGRIPSAPTIHPCQLHEYSSNMLTRRCSNVRGELVNRQNSKKREEKRKQA
jgi:hypothetical protein